MKALAACILLLLLCASGARADGATLTGETRTGRVVELTFATSAFSAPTKVAVNVPVGYDEQPLRRWPVTYVTAGTMNNYDSFNKLLKGEKLAEKYPAIIVSPDGNSGYWSDWYNGGAFGPPAYERFVIEELLPFIDGHFRTQPDRAHRMIFGISMGGYGAVMLAARHPDLFGAAATLSGATDSNNPALGAALSASSTFDGGAVDDIYGPRATQEIRWRGHNPVDLAENLRDVDLQVRTANGVPNPGIGEDPLSADTISCVIEGGVHMGSVSFHDRLTAIAKPHLWKDYGAGCHTVVNFTRETRDTLDAFTKLLDAGPPGPPATFSYKSMEPRFSVYGWTVEADARRALEFLQMQDAGAGGATFVGSGATTVTSPPLFGGLLAVDVDGVAVRPDAAGRVRFTVDLGAPHTVQQYTSGASSSFATRSVAFSPHARILLSGVRKTSKGVRVCLRRVGPAVSGVRVSFGRERRALRVSTRSRCLTLKHGGTVIRVTGKDSGGHAISVRRPVRAR